MEPIGPYLGTATVRSNRRSWYPKANTGGADDCERLHLLRRVTAIDRYRLASDKRCSFDQQPTRFGEERVTHAILRTA